MNDLLGFHEVSPSDQTGEADAVGQAAVQF